MCSRRICLILAGLVVAAALPSSASADALVYLKDGKVWVANADLSNARAFTTRPYNWSSPSMADDGTVVVAGGLAGVNPDGSDSDGSSELYRFQPDGNQIGGFTPTYGSYSTPSCPAYPPSAVRVSPDGTKIAYGIYGCAAGGYQTALWTPAGSTGLNFPNQTVGQQDFWNPIWINNSRFTISHAGPPVFGSHWGEHLVTDGDNQGQGWSETPMSDRAAEAVISRDGTESVVFYNDAAGFSDGKPRTVDMWVYANPSMPADFNAGWPDPPITCKFQFSDAVSRFGDINNLSPSLSPDGTKVMWGEADGVHLMSLGDVATGCAGAGSTDAAAVVPGGSQPFYAKGNLAPGAANPVQPDPSVPRPGPGVPASTSPVASPNPGPLPIQLRPVAKFKIVTKQAKLRARKKIAFDARASFEPGGTLVSYRWSFGDHKTGKGRRVTHKFRKKGTYTVTLTVRDTAGHTAAVKHKVKIR